MGARSQLRRYGSDCTGPLDVVKLMDTAEVSEELHGMLMEAAIYRQASDEGKARIMGDVKTSAHYQLKCDCQIVPLQEWMPLPSDEPNRGFVVHVSLHLTSCLESPVLDP